MSKSSNKTKSEGVLVTTQPELSGEGRAVARLADGRVAFIEGAAPSETVEIEILRDKGRFVEARVTAIQVSSAERVEPRCKHFGECGGCTTQHVSPEAQTRSKERAFAEGLVRIAKIPRGELNLSPAWSGPAWGYRSRARLLSEDGRVGLRRRHSHAVVDLTECPVLAGPLEASLPNYRGLDRSSFEIDLVLAGDRVLARAPFGEVARTSLEAAVQLEDAYGPRFVAPGVFAQMNEAGNAALLAEIAGELRSGPFLELYAGSGNLTRVLARAGAVTAIEVEGDAVQLGRRLLPSVDWKEGSVEKWVRSLGGSFQAIVVDPPREGLSADLAPQLAALSDRLLYVSCDPGTFARDAGRLRAAGLGLRRARLYDFYPHTEHAEVFGVFER